MNIVSILIPVVLFTPLIMYAMDALSHSGRLTRYRVILLLLIFPLAAAIAFRSVDLLKSLGIAISWNWEMTLLVWASSAVVAAGFRLVLGSAGVAWSMLVSGAAASVCFVAGQAMSVDEFSLRQALVFIMGFVIWQALPIRALGRWAKSQAVVTFHICPRCSYDLSALKANICPECGNSFDPGRTVGRKMQKAGAS